MKKYLFPIVIMSAFLVIMSGCNQQLDQTKENTLFQSKKIELKGKISTMPEQHMIDIQENYPYADYFDTDKTQYVIYSKEKITCPGELTIQGKTIEVKGTSKKPGSNEVYKEEQILVDSFKCIQEEKPVEKIISNEYPLKIVYTNDISKADLMKKDCSDRKGTFNTCGSPCAPEAEVCIQVCAYTCDLSNETKPLTPVTEINTAEWLKYSSKELGLSISYPSSLNKKEGEGSPLAFTVWGPTQKAETEFYDGINISFNKEIYEGSTSFEAFLNAQLATEKEIAESVSDPMPVSIGGKSAFRVDIVGLVAYTNYYIPLDGSYYLLISVMAPDPTGQGYEAIVNNMLESITFEPAV